MTDKKFTDKQTSIDESDDNEAAMDTPPPHDVNVLDQDKPVGNDCDFNSDIPIEKDSLEFEKPFEQQDFLAEMTAERDKLKDQLLRAMADTENMRRRSERESANVRKYGHTPFARDLVGAIDNLSRAVESAPSNSDVLDETIKSIITGIQLSWTELQSVIEKHGIKRVDPLGEKFDYNYHQAMFEVPTEDHVSGVVLEVVQHGYVLHDRLLRPAMVGVSKASDATSNKHD
ncbi:nucleotide exchange factor GrpE [Candidatus Puniceispirillum sp.]|nr:nucleotide exchange factor GrpE [Candidatus Puniceispirillum sp.]